MLYIFHFNCCISWQYHQRLKNPTDYPIGTPVGSYLRSLNLLVPILTYMCSKKFFIFSCCLDLPRRSDRAAPRPRWSCRWTGETGWHRRSSDGRWRPPAFMRSSPQKDRFLDSIHLLHLLHGPDSCFLATSSILATSSNM